MLKSVVAQLVAENEYREVAVFSLCTHTVILGEIHVNFASLVLCGYLSVGGVSHMDSIVRSA